MKIKTILIMLACSNMLAGICLAHPFHTTLTEIEYNAETKQLEIAIKFSNTDLEEALTTHTGENQHIDHTDTKNPILLDYIKSELAVISENEKQAIEWQGKQTEINNTWVYLTASVANCQADINNQLLSDIYAEQINTIVHIKNNKRNSFQLTGKNTIKKLIYC